MSNDSGDRASASSGELPGLPGLGALLGMLGLPNPLAPAMHAMDQMRRGFDDLLTMIETLQVTLEQLNTTAARVNRMLDDVEMPMRAMGDMMRRLGPLTQMAETASGLFNIKSFLPGGGTGDTAPAKKAARKPAPKSAPKSARS